MSFDWPIALLGLLLVPLLVGLYVWHESRRLATASCFVNPAMFPNVVDRAPGRLRHLPAAIGFVALTAMIFGVARPHATVSVKREEATIILAIDVSRSMKATDVKPTRLDAAREAARTFLLDVPPRFRVGVVSFATRAVVGVPPTEDRALVEASLRSLRPGEGTAIGDAVMLSLRVGAKQRASDGTTPPRAILLISDGTRDGGRFSPQLAAQEARKQRVPVYTVLLGTETGVVEETLVGGFRRLIRVPPSPETLAAVAEASGGEFFAATDNEQLRKVYDDLGSRLGARKEEREITDYFAAGAVALLFAGGALSALLFRRVP